MYPLLQKSPHDRVEHLVGLPEVDPGPAFSPRSSRRVHPDARDHSGLPMASYRHDTGRWASVIHSHDWALPLDNRYFGTGKSQCRTRPLPCLVARVEDLDLDRVGLEAPARPVPDHLPHLVGCALDDEVESVILHGPSSVLRLVIDHARSLRGCRLPAHRCHQFGLHHLAAGVPRQLGEDRRSDGAPCSRPVARRRSRSARRSSPSRPGGGRHRRRCPRPTPRGESRPPPPRPPPGGPAGPPRRRRRRRSCPLG